MSKGIIFRKIRGKIIPIVNKVQNLSFKNDLANVGAAAVLSVASFDIAGKIRKKFYNGGAVPNLLVSSLLGSAGLYGMSKVKGLNRGLRLLTGKKL